MSRESFHLDDEVAPLKLGGARRRCQRTRHFAFHLDDEVAPLKPLTIG